MKLDGTHLLIPRDLEEGDKFHYIPAFFLCAKHSYSADNQVAENFFKKYKEQVTRGGLKSMGSVLAETRKFLQFPDCTVPPDDVVTRFLDVCDAAPAAPSRCTAARGSAARGRSSRCG